MVVYHFAFAVVQITRIICVPASMTQRDETICSGWDPWDPRGDSPLCTVIPHF